MLRAGIKKRFKNKSIERELGKSIDCALNSSVFCNFREEIRVSGVAYRLLILRYSLGCTHTTYTVST